MSHSLSINTGIADKDRQKLNEILSGILADTYLLYLKTQNFHWNVTGPRFSMLHELFEEQYEALAKAIDTIAERIRALHFKTPASFAQFLSLATLKEQTAMLDADQMIEQLLHYHEVMTRTIRATFTDIEQTEDKVTEDMLIERLEHHEKTAWILRSSA